MKYILLIATLAASIVHAQELPPEQDCNFVAWWANKAFHISHTIGLDADKWTITEEGFEPEAYRIIMQIKHEAYNDLNALRRRVETVCAEKEPT